MTSPCDVYATPTLTWPKQQFPGDHPAVSRLSQGERMAAKRAWNFFEEVETVDAAKRVRLGLTGGALNRPPPGTWYEFNGEDQRALYNRGRYLHRRICPSYNWTPQRNLTFPTIPLDTVTPAECPCVGDDCSDSPVLLARAVPPAPTPPLTRSAQLIQQGIPGSPSNAYRTIDIVANTPSTPLSAGTPQSAGTPTSVGSPAAPSTPSSTKEPAPKLEVEEMSLATPEPEVADPTATTIRDTTTEAESPAPAPVLEVTDLPVAAPGETIQHV